MNLFLGQNYLKANYFKPAYLHGSGTTPPEQDGRSGYWKLFFMQMQEEALKKTKEVVAEAVEKVLPTPTSAKKAVKKREKEVKPFEPELELPKLKPIYSQVTPSPVQNLPWALMLISTEIQEWYLQYQPILEAQRVKIVQQTESANDADYRIRLLLLAA